jgi:tetratricopeptide (TPR) repeat protein
MMDRLILIFVSMILAHSAFAQGSAFAEEDEASATEAPQEKKLSVSGDLEDKFASALKSKDEDRVVSAAAQILGRDSSHLKTLNGLGVFYMDQKKYGMAKIIFQRALKSHPNTSAALNNLGVVALIEGDMRLALENFKKSSSQSNSKTAQANLSSILVSYGDYDRAVDPLSDAYGDIKKELKKSGDVGIAVANNYGVALMGAGKGSRAESVFETIVESGVRAPEPYLNYAILLVEVLKKKSAAQKILSKIQFMTEDRKILRKVSDLERQLK